MFVGIIILKKYSNNKGSEVGLFLSPHGLITMLCLSYSKHNEKNSRHFLHYFLSFFAIKMLPATASGIIYPQGTKVSPIFSSYFNAFYNIFLNYQQKGFLDSKFNLNQPK